MTPESALIRRVKQMRVEHGRIHNCTICDRFLEEILEALNDS